MAPLALRCPLCCNETFSSHSSLKYHILSMIDNLICPSCNERCDDLMDMADHLGRECKNIGKEASPEKILGTESTTEHQSSVSSAFAQVQIKREIEDPLIDMTAADEDTTVENGLQDEDEMQNEAHLLYTCQVCDLSFNSVKDHLAKYHEGEEVLLETDEQDDTRDFLVYDDDDPQNMDVDSGDVTISEAQDHDTALEEDGSNDIDSPTKVSNKWTNEESNNLNPITTKYIVDNGKVRKLEADEERTIQDKLSIIDIHCCPNCSLQFPNINHFLKHKCSLAKLSGKRRDRKFLKVKEELRYQCTFCQAIYSSLIALNDHMKAHLVHDESGMVQKKTITMSLHVCKVCNTKFPSFKQLRLHSRMHEPVKSKKVDPPVSYNIMGEVEESQLADDSEREVFQCPVCKKAYYKEYEEVHLKSHDEQEVNICYVCNRKFDTKENLEMHMTAHSDTKKFACSYCKKPFISYESLENHVVNQCQKRQYECQYCGRRFVRPHEKVKHERIHTGEKPHVCQICNKSFRVSYCLTLHMRTHSGTRPYSCQDCGKRFKSHSVYNHHRKTHSEERKYKCPYCPKAFKTAVQLAGHKNSHTKPFSCKKCNRPFASLYAVRAHMETHKRDNNLRFDCWICGASYARSFALRDHLSEAHGESTLIDNQQEETVLSIVENKDDDDDDQEEIVEQVHEENEEGHFREADDDEEDEIENGVEQAGEEEEQCQIIADRPEGENENYVVL